MLLENKITQPNLVAREARRVQTPENAASRVKLCVVVTVDITLLNLCRGRFEYLMSQGFDVTAVCAPTKHADEMRARGVRLVTLPLTRSITPWADLRAMVSLWRMLRRERFDIVEVSTPKGALIGSIAARAARVPCVVHLLRGLAYEGQAGLKRWLVKLAHTIPCRLSHELIAVSNSLRNQALQDGLCSSDEIRVLGNGSSNGVDLERFRPQPRDVQVSLRRELDIPPDAIVVGFVGRMNRDKGIEELTSAFLEVADARPEVYLLLVGAFEDQDRPGSDAVEVIERHPRVRHVGWQSDTARFYAAMDMLTLPTHREGFGGVLLEAAASGLPTIATDIVGCRDGVIPETTGILVNVRDASSLASAIVRLAEDAPRRAALGSAGRLNAQRKFAQEKVWALQGEALRTMAARYARTPERRAALSVLKKKTVDVDAVKLTQPASRSDVAEAQAAEA